MNEPTLTEHELSTLATIINELGERAAAAELGVGVDSLLRILARRPNVRRGTIALLQRSLEHRARKTVEG